MLVLFDLVWSWGFEILGFGFGGFCAVKMFGLHKTDFWELLILGIFVVGVGFSEISEFAILALFSGCLGVLLIWCLKFW